MAGMVDVAAGMVRLRTKTSVDSLSEGNYVTPRSANKFLRQVHKDQEVVDQEVVGQPQALNGFLATTSSSRFHTFSTM